MTQHRFFGSESGSESKDRSDERKTSAELPVYILTDTSDFGEIFNSNDQDLGSFRCKAKLSAGGDEELLICRKYDLSGMPDLCSRLHQEDLALAQRIGKHPNILQLKGTGNGIRNQKDQPFLVYENGGRSGALYDLLYIASDLELQYPLSARIVWAAEAINAISHLHQLDLFHGAITAENVVFDRGADNKVHLKIADVMHSRFDKEYQSNKTEYSCQNIDRSDYERWSDSDEVRGKGNDIRSLGLLIGAIILLRLPYAGVRGAYPLSWARESGSSSFKENLLNLVGSKFADFILQCCELDPKKRLTIEKVKSLWVDVQQELNEFAQKQPVFSTLKAAAVHLSDSAIAKLKTNLELKTDDEVVCRYCKLSSLEFKSNLISVLKEKFGCDSLADSSPEKNLALWFLITRDGMSPEAANNKLCQMSPVEINSFATGLNEELLARVAENHKKYFLQPEFMTLPLETKFSIARYFARFHYFDENNMPILIKLAHEFPQQSKLIIDTIKRYRAEFVRQAIKDTFKKPKIFQSFTFAPDESKQAVICKTKVFHASSGAIIDISSTSNPSEVLIKTTSYSGSSSYIVNTVSEAKRPVSDLKNDVEISFDFNELTSKILALKKSEWLPVAESYPQLIRVIGSKRDILVVIDNACPKSEGLISTWKIEGDRITKLNHAVHSMQNVTDFFALPGGELFLLKGETLSFWSSTLQPLCVEDIDLSKMILPQFVQPEKNGFSVYQLKSQKELVNQVKEGAAALRTFGSIPEIIADYAFDPEEKPINCSLRP